MAELFTAVSILNQIRDNASQTYIERIPTATIDNLSSIGDAITSDKNLENEFINALIDKIAITIVKSKLFVNPLARLKKGTGRPLLGRTVEEIFINPAKGEEYSNDGTLLLKRTDVDAKTCYYALNRQNDYPATISEAQIKQGFNSPQAFMSFLAGITNSLYSGDSIDEYMLTKNLFSKAIDEGNLPTVEVDLAEPKEFAKALSNQSSYFNFPSTAYCPYNIVNKDKLIDSSKTEEENKNKKTKCLTWCPTKNQVLLLRADANTEINYEVLASFFNLQLAEVKAMTILIDTFDTKDYDTYAVLCDIETVQVIDDVFTMNNQYIPKTLSYNVWLHHWQWLFLSMFTNCVAFVKKKETV